MVSKGSIHQGDIESGGRQCTYIALVFLISNIIPKSECETDNFLQKGTSLYHILCSHGCFMLITEFPELVRIDNDDFNLKVKDPRSGMTSQKLDDHDSVTFTLESAVEQSFAVARTCFLTV